MFSKKSELVCCNLCGRDTSARDGICSRCRSPFFDHSEEIGRRRRTVTESDSPLDQFNEENKFHKTSFEDYHGESVRDDI